MAVVSQALSLLRRLDVAYWRVLIGALLVILAYFVLLTFLPRLTWLVNWLDTFGLRSNLIAEGVGLVLTVILIQILLGAELERREQRRRLPVQQLLYSRLYDWAGDVLTNVLPDDAWDYDRMEKVRFGDYLTSLSVLRDNWLQRQQNFFAPSETRVILKTLRQELKSLMLAFHGLEDLDVWHRMVTLDGNFATAIWEVTPHGELQDDEGIRSSIRLLARGARNLQEYLHTKATQRTMTAEAG